MVRDFKSNLADQIAKATKAPQQLLGLLFWFVFFPDNVSYVFSLFSLGNLLNDSNKDEILLKLLNSVWYSIYMF